MAKPTILYISVVEYLQILRKLFSTQIKLERQVEYKSLSITTSLQTSEPAQALQWDDIQISAQIFACHLTYSRTQLTALHCLYPVVI